MFIQKRRIVAENEVMDQGAEVNVEEMDVLFEASDVAELIAEVTGDSVEVTTDEDSGDVIFAVGEDEYTVTPEEDTEILESTRRTLRGKKPVSASTRRPAASNTRYVKKFNSKK